MYGNSAAHEDIELAIDVFDCTACQTDPIYPGTFRPGDSLEGRILLSSKSKLKVANAKIQLQGLQLASVFISTPSQPNGVEVRSSKIFLDASYPLFPPESSRPQYAFTFPFQFIMPERCVNVNANLPVLCEQLPPSFNVGNSYSRVWTQHPRPEVSITYRLYCTVALYNVNGSTGKGQITIKAEKDIRFLPYTESQPPSFVAKYPEEFILELERPIWKHFWGRRLGKLTVITEEPNPLTYTSAVLAPSTSCKVRINLAGASINAQYLRNISLKVTSVLRSKTYYSVKDIPCVPNQTLLTDNGFLRLYDDVCKVGMSKFKNLEWIYVPTHGYQNENGPPDKPQSDKVAAWTSLFHFSVSPEHRLQPTFCTKHVARSYSLLFRIHISGAYVEMVDCEVPLQVVFPPTKILDPHSSAYEAAPRCLGSAAIRRQDIVRRHIDMAIAGSDAE